MLISKLANVWPLVIIFLGGIMGGSVVQKKFLNDDPIACPVCPACNCPESVKVQPFEMEKMKGVKEFNYRPEFTGNISVAGVDSTMIKKYLDDAVRKYCLDLSQQKRKRR